MKYRNWWPLLVALLLVVGMAAQAATPTVSLPKGTSVILDDGTPFLKGEKLAPPPPTIGSPYNDWLFCANHTATVEVCYACASTAYANGGTKKLYVSAIYACDVVESFR